ncbi:MAG: hypothetical protein HFI35_15155 [Roseburia sp.]|nr:hypothetical protein [Roseburia sp.]
MAGRPCCAAWKCEPGDRIAKPQPGEGRPCCAAPKCEWETGSRNRSRGGEAVLRGAKV